MRNFLKPFAFIMCLSLGLAIITTSCGGDDPPAELDKDKFIGNYVGEVACAGLLASVIDDPALSFNISNTVGGEDDRVQINLPTLTIPLEIVGIVSGNNLTFEKTTIEDVMITDPVPVTADIEASGTATLTGNALVATIDLKALTTAGAELATDKCTINATKQN